MQSGSFTPILRARLLCLLVVAGIAPAKQAHADSRFRHRLSGESHQQKPLQSSPVFQSIASEEESPGSARGSFVLHQLWDDMTYLVTQPDFYGVAGGLGLAPSTFGSAFRHESPEFTEMWGRSGFADNLFEIGEVVGDGAFPVMLSGASWSVGKLAGSAKLRDFGTDLFRAQAMTGLLTAVLKGSVNRTRPDGTAYSYPSGHTSSAFASAGTVYAHFGKQWGIPAFVFAGYVGLSRLQEGKHYVSDVLAGGILGTYISLKLARKGRKREAVSIAPAMVGSGLGLSLSVRM